MAVKRRFIGLAAACAVLLGGCGGAAPTGSVPAPTDDAPTPSELRFAIVAGDAEGVSQSLFVMDPAGGRTPVPVSGIPGYEIAARPGSTEIALSVTRCVGESIPCRSSAVILDLATGEERPLIPVLDPQIRLAPSWSPDGSQLVFSAGRPGNPFLPALYRVGADGGEPVPIETGLPYAVNPAWSPDGTTIAFAGDDGTLGVGYNAGLYLVDAGGGVPRKLIEFTRVVNPPLSWSPDGTRIAYGVSNEVQTGENEFTGYDAIAVVDVDDGSSSVIRATRSNNSAPAWSPDGSTIAFIEQGPAGSRLAAMDPGGLNVRDLGAVGWNDVVFAWLP